MEVGLWGKGKPFWRSDIWAETQMSQGRSQAVIWKTSPGRENRRAGPSELSWVGRSGLPSEGDEIWGKAVVFSGGDPQSGPTAEGRLPAACPAAGGVSVSFLKGHLGGTSQLPSPCSCISCLSYCLADSWKNESLSPKIYAKHCENFIEVLVQKYQGWNVTLDVSS